MTGHPDHDTANDYEVSRCNPKALCHGECGRPLWNGEPTVLLRIGMGPRGRFALVPCHAGCRQALDNVRRLKS